MASSLPITYPHERAYAAARERIHRAFAPLVEGAIRAPVDDTRPRLQDVQASRDECIRALRDALIQVEEDPQTARTA